MFPHREERVPRICVKRNQKSAGMPTGIPALFCRLPLPVKDQSHAVSRQDDDGVGHSVDPRRGIVVDKNRGEEQDKRRRRNSSTVGAVPQASAVTKAASGMTHSIKSMAVPVSRIRRGRR